MAIAIIILILILMRLLGNKGKAYREEKAMNSPGAYLRQSKEDAYRAKLRDEGYDEELITTILPTIMNGK